MSDPVNTYIQAPDDSGNTGKKIRTQTRVVGANTVHEHFFVEMSSRSIEGVYYADPGVSTIQASATNGTSTGFWWLQNPAGGTTSLSVRRVKIEHTISATTVFQSNPRVALALFTFTGTASGAAVSIAKGSSANASAQGSLRTAATGMTISLGNILHSTLPVSMGSTTTSVVTSQAIDLVRPIDGTDDTDTGPVLLTGEGMACYQPDAGTASDTRKFDTDVVWYEFDNT